MELAGVIPVLKESSSSDIGDYRSISITPVLSKAFEKRVTGQLSHFWKVYFRIEGV